MTTNQQHERHSIQDGGGVRASSIGLADDTELMVQVRGGGTVASPPVPTHPVPTRGRRAPLLAALAAGLAAIGVVAAVIVLADEPPPTVVPTPTRTDAPPQLSVAEEVAIINGHSGRTQPTDQLTVAEEVAIINGTAKSVPSMVDLCLNQTPC